MNPASNNPAIAKPLMLPAGEVFRLKLDAPSVDQLVLSCHCVVCSASSVNIAGKSPSSKLSFS